MKRTVTVEIAGAKYRLVADADEERLQQLADVVNERVEQLGANASRMATPAQLLALTALGLADDLLTTQERLRQIDELTRTTVTQAIERIDKRIAEHREQGED